jgi:hypothetical protein
MNPTIFDKIIKLINDPSFTVADEKLKQASFSRDDELYILLKNYCILYKNNGASTLSTEIPIKIQNLYQIDIKVQDFFDYYLI